jgi:hypothetical protein
VFLFVGDAQVGNWVSWRAQKYRAGGKTRTAEDLLRRTVLYKVGHHASHNGTMKVAPADVSDAKDRTRVPFGLPLMTRLQVALIPVDRKAVEKKMPNPWKMPYKRLYGRLLERASGRVLRSDGEEPERGVDGPPAVAPPESGKEQAIPRAAGASWKEAADCFTEGRKCPLYYDLKFPGPRRGGHGRDPAT